MRHYTLKDEVRTVEFDGELIGEATNKSRGHHRWTEVRVYRTEAGRFVVETVGKSEIFHLTGRSCSRGTPAVYDDLHEPRWVECPICRPDHNVPLSGDVLVEVDRPTIRDWGTFAELGDGLRVRNSAGNLVLSRVTLDALAQAREALGDDATVVQL